jgi:hypothetical protein
MVQVLRVGGVGEPLDLRTAKTDQQGRCEIRGLAVGDYRILVGQRNGQPDLTSLFQGIKTPKVITVAAGETKEIDL